MQGGAACTIQLTIICHAQASIGVPAGPQADARSGTACFNGRSAAWFSSNVRRSKAYRSVFVRWRRSHKSMVVRRAACALDALEHALQVRPYRVTKLRQAYRRLSPEQFASKLGFQRLDRNGQRWLGHAAALRRPREAEFVAQHQEVFDLLETHAYTCRNDVGATGRESFGVLASSVSFCECCVRLPCHSEWTAMTATNCPAINAKNASALNTDLIGASTGRLHSPVVGLSSEYRPERARPR
jgi:hypothetical protein